MNTLWRWSTLPYVFLLIILNVEQNLCQIEAQLTLQGDPVCNLRIAKPNQQINKCIQNPQNSIPECMTPQNLLINTSPSISPLNTQGQQGTIKLQLSGLSESFSHPTISTQSQCPRPPTACIPQLNVGLELQSQVPCPPFPQSVFPNPGSSTGSPVIGSSNPGLGFLSQGPQICSQDHSLPFPNSPQCFDSQITASAPTANGRQCRQPDFCGDRFGPQELNCPKPYTSRGPLIPLNNPGFPECTSPVSSQGSILKTSQFNRSPQGPSVSSQCNYLHETPYGLPSAGELSSVDCPLQMSLPPVNTFVLAKPTLFHSAPFLGPLTSPCDTNNVNPSIHTQNLGCVQGCDGRDFIREQLFLPQQAPVAPSPTVLNTPPGFLNQNTQLCPLPPPVCQPVLPLNLGYCTTNQPSTNGILNFVQPCPISQNHFGSQVSNCAPISSPINVCPPQCPTPYSFLALPLSVPNCDIPCQSGTANALPTPINLKINVPPPNIPPPKITIINLTPQPAPVAITAEEPNLVNNIPVGVPPIIIEGRKSRSRLWWPLLLFGLFSGDGGFGCC